MWCLFQLSHCAAQMLLGPARLETQVSSSLHERGKSSLEQSPCEPPVVVDNVGKVPSRS
jgi:hypothetical protein